LARTRSTTFALLKAAALAADQHGDVMSALKRFDLTSMARAGLVLVQCIRHAQRPAARQQRADARRSREQQLQHCSRARPLSVARRLYLLLGTASHPHKPYTFLNPRFKARRSVLLDFRLASSPH
tara:strand:- start:227 stop:601 length:375 start_codon:yes stop_codon:yes gene_type:complete